MNGDIMKGLNVALETGGEGVGPGVVVVVELAGGGALADVEEANRNTIYVCISPVLCQKLVAPFYR